MSYYKIPPHLAKKVPVLYNNSYCKLKDGNYLAYWTHMKDLCGSSYAIDSMLAPMGCIEISGDKAYDELIGRSCIPLPEPTDPKYLPPTEEPTENVETTEELTQEPSVEPVLEESEPTEDAEPTEEEPQEDTENAEPLEDAVLVKEVLVEEEEPAEETLEEEVEADEEEPIKEGGE